MQIKEYHRVDILPLKSTIQLFYEITRYFMNYPTESVKVSNKYTISNFT